MRIATGKRSSSTTRTTRWRRPTAWRNPAESHLRKHQVLARSVTLFQITIAIGAISVLTKRRRFWLLSLMSGAIGVVFFVQGLWFVR